MIATVNSPFGTAFRSRIKSKLGSMGGKTGTVQVRRISKMEREKGVKKLSDLIDVQTMNDVQNKSCLKNFFN